MCSLWEGGLEGVGTGPPDLTLPTSIRTLQPLACGLVLLDQDGQIWLYREGKVRSLSCEEQLGPVEELVTGTLLGNHEEEEEDSFICLLSSGRVCKVVLGVQERVEEMSAHLGVSVTHMAFSTKHALYIDIKGQVWSRGEVPYCGLVQESPKVFVRVPFFTGVDVLSILVGPDFSLCLARPSESSTDSSPLSPEEAPSGPKTSTRTADHDGDGSESCPLGLSLKSTTTSPRPTGGLRLDHNLNLTRGALKESIICDAKDKEDCGRKSNQDVDVPDLAPVSIPRPVTLAVDNCVKLDHLNNGLTAPPRLPSDPMLEWSAQKTEHEGNISVIQTAVLPNSLSVDDLECCESSRPVRQLAVKRSVSLGALSPKGGSILLKEATATAPAALVAQGRRFHATEVWSWGSGARGQLGQGDMLSRPTPSPVPGLQGRFVVKVAAGRHHVLALTGDGQIFGWGDNTLGQACPTETLAVVLHPARLQIPQEETARDVTACENMSCVLTDSGKIYVAGGGEKSNRLRIITTESLACRPGHRPTGAFLPSGYFVLNTAAWSAETASLVSKEKVMLRQVDSVQQLLNTLFQSSSVASIEPTLQTVQQRLSDAAGLLAACIHRTACSVSALLDFSQTGVFRHSRAWEETARSLCAAVCDCIAADSLHLDGAQAHHQHLITEVLVLRFGLPQSAVQGQVGLEQILVLVLKTTDLYVKGLAALLVTARGVRKPLVKEEVHSDDDDGWKVKGLETRLVSLMALLQEMERERQVAERTRHFWKSIGSSSSRLIESQLPTVPSRRLVLDSRYQPVSLVGAMTKHWLLLMTDVLVDYGYQLAVHPLQTVWLESLPTAASTSRYEIALIMPEERKTLSAATSAERNVWLQALLRTIASSLRGSRSETNLPPVTRTARYEFTRGEFRGSIYSGCWTQAKMHGKGSMRFPDGSVYDGEWRGGLQDGWGRLSRPDGRWQEGTWRSGRLCGHGGHLIDPDGSQYEGDLADGQPHGHGTKKEGRFMNRGASIYVGQWERGQRHGYGVLDDITAGEKYMGMWAAGQRQGPACVVNSDGIYYEGNFVHNKLTGGGLMIFEDGTVYEGEFCGAGEFSGKGVLTTATERFEGVFHGNYADRMRFNGVVVRHAAPQTPGGGSPSLERIRQHTVPAYKKWTSIFQQLDELLGTESCWDQIAIAINLNKVRARERSALTNSVSVNVADSLEMIPEVGRPGLQLDWARYEEVEQYLSAAGQCELHPFYYILRQLTECFITSYGGVRSHATLLPHAREELESVCSRLYQLLRRLFPLLPAPESPCWLTSPHTREPFIVTPNTVLLPLLLPLLYPTIFTLYALREQKADTEYWTRIIRWNRLPDLTLLTFFDVDFSLWEISVDRRGRDQLFLTAIHNLQKLKTTFSPHDKLEVVVETFRAITGQAETANQTWSMDALLPVGMYVVVRARVLQLGAELAMLQDFMDSHLFQGEQGILYTTLLAAYHQILRESVFIQ